MTGLKLAASTPNPIRPGGSFTHIEHNMIDERTMAHVVNLVQRVTGDAEITVKATVLWAQELIVYRDHRNAICGAHGFRFADVKDAEREYRLVYSPFSVVDQRFVDPVSQLEQVGTRLHGRLHESGTPVIWATVTNCGDMHAAPGGFLTSHSLTPSAGSHLPPTLRYYTDAADVPDVLPPAVETAFRGMVDEQEGTVTDAKAGRLILVPLWRRIGSGTMTALMAAAAVLFLVTRTHTNVDAGAPQTEMRTKGGAGLHVFRQTGTGSEEVFSRGAFTPGDHLRFGIDLAAESRVAIVGVQANGDLYVAWPQADGSAKSVLPAGQKQTLEGAVTLDASTGEETLYLVSCSPASIAPTCRSRGVGVAPECPSGCTLSPFVLEKQAH
jgi:hypothetical protein